MSDSRPIAVDLFAGAGGLALGFEQAGFDVVAAVEFDPIHAAVHELNFPTTAVMCRDIQAITGDNIRSAASIGRRSVDVVIGGPPCQGFSLIGHRVLEDERNSLVFHFLRLVEELRPKAFVMENVPGMATGAHRQLLDELISQFGAAGYRVKLKPRLLNAAHYGVPQDRRRLFLLGTRSDCRAPDYPTPSTSAPVRNGNGDLFASSRCPTVADAIGDLPDIEQFPELLEQDVWEGRLKGGSVYAKILRGDIVDPEDFSHPRAYDHRLLTGCLRAVHTPLSRKRFRSTTPGTTEPVSRFFRLAADGLSNTLRAGTASDRGAFSAPRPIHPEHARCISVREAARLHSYPDWFRFHWTIWHGFRQIGNSVPPFLGRAVGSSVLKALGLSPSKPHQVLPLGDETLAMMKMRDAEGHFGIIHRAIPPRRRLALARQDRR